MVKQDWVPCWGCKGEALVRACPLTLYPAQAEACPHDPPCPLKRCNICAGNRGWYRAPEAATTQSEGHTP